MKGAGIPRGVDRKIYFIQILFNCSGGVQDKNKAVQKSDTIFIIIIEPKLNPTVNQKCQFAWKKTSSLFMVIVHLGAGRDLNVGRLEVAATINDATTKNNSIKKIASLFSNLIATST